MPFSVRHDEIEQPSPPSSAILISLVAGPLACRSDPAAVLVDGLRAPVRLIADESRIYWTDSLRGSVFSARHDGSDATLLAQEQGRPVGIALSDGLVYWASSGSGTLSRVPAEGGEPIVLVSGQSAPSLVAVRGGRLFWLNYGKETWEGYLPNTGAIVSANLDGTAIAIIADQQHRPSALLVDDANVYWSTLSTSSDPNDGAVWRFERATGHTSLVAGSLPGPRELGFSGIQLACANWGRTSSLDAFRTNGSIVRIDVTNGNVANVASDQQHPGALLSLGEDLYWSTRDDVSATSEIRHASSDAVDVTVSVRGRIPALIGEGAFLFAAINADANDPRGSVILRVPR